RRWSAEGRAVVPVADPRRVGARDAAIRLPDARTSRDDAAPRADGARVLAVRLRLRLRARLGAVRPARHPVHADRLDGGDGARRRPGPAGRARPAVEARAPVLARDFLHLVHPRDADHRADLPLVLGATAARTGR